MVVVEVLEASVLVVLVEVLGTVGVLGTVLGVEVLETEVVVRGTVLEALVRGTVGVLVVLVHLGEDLVEISLEAAAEADHSAALAVVAGSRLPVDRVRRDPPGMGDVATVLRAYLPDSENLEWGTPVQS